jgi:hypothetical protein
MPGGTVKPIAFAVFRFTTVSYLVGNRTGLIRGISIRTLHNKLNECTAYGASVPPSGCAKFRGVA